MGLLDAIEKLINERGSATIMRERLELIREQAAALEKQVALLKQENASLQRHVAELEHQVMTKAAADEFVEGRGALFKRKPADHLLRLGKFCGNVPINKCSRSKAVLSKSRTDNSSFLRG